LAKGSKTAAATSIYLLSKQDVEVSGRDLWGLLLLIYPPSTINGKVFLDGAADSKIDRGEVILKPVEPVVLTGYQKAQIQPDGTFAITNCEAANYAVRFSPPAGTYIKSIVFNGQDAMSHPLDLSRGSGGEVDIMLRPGAASVVATIQDSGEPAKKGTATPEMDVVMIPDSWAENGLIPVLRAAHKDGRYAVGGMAPGHYSAVAAAGVDPRLWENPVFVHEMEARGLPVDLVENDQKQIVLPVLTGQDVDQIELRLGIY
jgi:hypothetical protein